MTYYSYLIVGIGMDQRGLFEGDDLASARFRSRFGAAVRDDAAAANRQLRGRQGIQLPAYFDEYGIRAFVRTEMLRSVDPDQVGIEQERALPDTSSDATIAALQAQLAEARSDKKLADAVYQANMRSTEMIGTVNAGFAELKGQVATLGARLEGIERSTSGLRTTIFGTGIAVVAVVVSVVVGTLTYGQAWFGIGVSTRDIVRATVTEFTKVNQPAPQAPQSSGH